MTPDHTAVHMLAARVMSETDGDTATVVQAVVDAILARYAVVEVPDAKNPTPALIEAAYIAQDDLSTPPTWAIGAAAEVIQAYIDGQGHTQVHVLGHPVDGTESYQ